MTQQLVLSPELMSRLKTEANRLGEPVDQVAERLLAERLPPTNLLESNLRLLAQWAEEAKEMDEIESETNAAILRAIDEDRLSDRKLFTAVLEGKVR
jgi:hypothetical protein